MQALRIIIAGIGNMGKSHAIACQQHPGFDIVALVNRSQVDLPESLNNIPMFNDFYEALASVECDAVSINTYSDSHAEYAVASLEKDKHVFLEKPVATTVEDAERVVEAATRCNKKLVIGYILRHHPSWVRLIKEARQLGGPYVFRLNLNQQSSAETWQTHKQLMQTTSPIVDCGVHYIDVMCQITDALPVKVNGMGLRLSNEIAESMYNYGHFQVFFDDGSVGWYEAGWGPMMSESAYFVKDIISPAGAVSIVMDDAKRSDDIDSHTRTASIRIHHSTLNNDGTFSRDDACLDMSDEPDHQELCCREQDYFYQAVVNDIDLSRHWRDAVQSLRVCLAADESVRTGNIVRL